MVRHGRIAVQLLRFAAVISMLETPKTNAAARYLARPLYISHRNDDDDACDERLLARP